MMLLSNIQSGYLSGICPSPDSFKSRGLPGFLSLGFHVMPNLCLRFRLCVKRPMLSQLHYVSDNTVYDSIILVSYPRLSTCRFLSIHRLYSRLGLRQLPHDCLSHAPLFLVIFRRHIGHFSAYCLGIVFRRIPSFSRFFWLMCVCNLVCSDIK